jgi:hypothetical protein
MDVVSTRRSGRSIDAIVAGGVAAWFKHRGFSRKGRAFFRERGELFDTASVQASKLNVPGDAFFALNLGVEWPWWYSMWTGKSVGNPAVAPTFIKTRLHPIEGCGRDYWWKATEENALSLAGEITHALGEHAEPFWAKYGNLDLVLEEFAEGTLVPTGTPKRLVHAGLLVRAGQPDAARALIAEHARRLGSVQSCQLIASRLGLGAYAA